MGDVAFAEVSDDPGRPATDAEQTEQKRLEKHPLAKKVVAEFMADVKKMTATVRKKRM